MGGDGYKYQIGNRVFNYQTGGAGIGGNGFFEDGEGKPVYEGQGPNFGQINITGGTVNATGGVTTVENRGAGAGIGNGGASCEWTVDPVFEGTIHISGGVVTATGGDGSQATGSSAGGAGIGSGGVAGDIQEPLHTNTSIIISDGVVNAYGKADGAGIGSGANVDSGSIEITGGTITAIGGDEGDGTVYGGAGIGGGDNGSASKILISGTANVTAQGGGTAAGIGGGPYGFVKEICILEQAQVNAIGGKEMKPNRNRGGAGIGCGRRGSVEQIRILGQAQVKAVGGGGAAGIGGGFDGAVGIDGTFDSKITGGITIEGAVVEAYGGRYFYDYEPDASDYGGAGIGSGISYDLDNCCGKISITNGATVRAYTEGKETNAIGVGGCYGGTHDNSLVLDDNISLWAQTPDNSWPALLNVPADSVSYQSRRVYLTTNNLTTGKADGYLNQPGAQADEAWDFQLGTDLTIDGNPVSMAAPKAPVGNWATLYQLPAFMVTYQYVGELPDGAAPLAPDSVAPGAQFTLKQPAGVTGWQFDGWYTDAACTAKFAGDAGITGDTVLYGRWNPLSTPIGPKAAVYKVEHVQKQPDGTYKLADAEFPLYGEIGQTVTAVPKSYVGYVVNRAASTLSGVVIPPAGDVYLVLTVRYDPAPQITATPQPGAVPPRTGDSASPLLWLSLLIASALGMGGVVASKSKMW